MEPRKIMEVKLPIALPTWNRLLACNHWQRRKIRHFVHDFVCKVLDGEQITDEELAEYDKAIRPKAKKKATRKKS